MELIKFFNCHYKPKIIGLRILMGSIILVSIIYAMMSNSQMSHSPNSASTSPTTGAVISNELSENRSVTQKRDLECIKSEGISDACQKNNDVKMHDNSSSKSEHTESDQKQLCDTSDRNTDICDMRGDIRVMGKNQSSVVFVSPSQFGNNSENPSWHIQPYPRKWDMQHNVRIVNVRTLHSYEKAPPCSVNHTVPGIIFSISGLTGNYYHDFIEVLVPLFETSREFAGAVQFLVTGYNAAWIAKYADILKKLSLHQIINYDDDDRVHCFKHVIVGLRFDGELIIDTRKSPNGYSMLDFTKLLRSAYSLDRERPLSTAEKKPRLLIIARSKNRKLTNLKKIACMARDVGYEVVTAEGDANITRFSRVVNSCDVLMGVHGSGLTNCVFLPADAILVQVVPFGKLERLARTCFREPARAMKLRYLEYSASVDESSLVKKYPRDDPVLKDPESIKRQGWGRMASAYLLQQDIELDLRRFRPVLEQAFKLLQGTRNLSAVNEK